MNCIREFIDCALRWPERDALWEKSRGIATFGELYRRSVRTQALLRDRGIRKGDCALICIAPGPELYAAVIALLGMGCCAMFIEPWMPLSEIEAIVEQAQPKAYISGIAGKFWGWRTRAIRKIPVWMSASSIGRGYEPNQIPLDAEDLSGDQAALLTFTTGTSGTSKGVVRTHGGLSEACAILSKCLGLDPNRGGCDLCALPNFALLNLSCGICSALLPRKLSQRACRKIAQNVKASSATCGPALLKELIAHGKLFPDLTSIRVGGALSECGAYEQGFVRWPSAEWLQIYGSSEAEPVALADAKEVVRKCRERNLHQTAYLGRSIEGIKTHLEEGALWVSGAHVSPYYFGNSEANRTDKRTDADGRLWHRMGDRIAEDADGWWYRGRISQDASEFLLEQEIAGFLQTDAAIVSGRTCLVDRGVSMDRAAFLHRFPALKEVVACRIYRDRRHRARIDRKKTIRKGAPWLVG